MPNDARTPEPCRDLQGGLPEVCEKQPSSRMDLLRNNDININFLSSGCIIRIGCKTIAFSTVEEGMNELTMYVANPSKSIEKWYAIFNKNE